MLEIEPWRCDRAILVKNNIFGVVLSTDVIDLTAVTFYFYLRESIQLLIKAQHRSFRAIASFVPDLFLHFLFPDIKLVVVNIGKRVSNEVIKGAYPALNWWEYRALQCIQLRCHCLHDIQVFRVRVVHIFEYYVSWRPNFFVLIRCFMEVITIRILDEKEIGAESQLEIELG